MRLKKCTKCGELFNTDKNGKTMCDACVAAARSTTIRPRTCHECGAVFDGGPRAWYCPDCRAARQKEQAANYRRNGAARSIGSIDICEVCKREYVVTGGLQRYCPDCAEEAIREKDREASRRWNVENHFHEKRSQTPRSGQKVCVICGKPVPPGTPRVTCSPECDKLRRRSPSGVERLDKTLPAAPVILTPKVIKELEPDLLSVIKRCQKCGKPFVRKSGAAKFCRSCTATTKSYQAEYYAKNKERIKAQRKAKREQDPREKNESADD